MSDTTSAVDPFADVDETLNQPDGVADITADAAAGDIRYEGGMTVADVEAIEDPAQQFAQATVEIEYRRTTEMPALKLARARAARKMFDRFGGAARSGAQARAARALGLDRSQMNSLLRYASEADKRAATVEAKAS